MKRNTAVAVDLSQKLLCTCKNDLDLRLKKSAFTKERELGAKRMLHIIYKKGGRSSALLHSYLCWIFNDQNEYYYL